MTASDTAATEADQLHVPEPYESYAVGDEVWCLAWIGMPFVVTGKNDETGVIEIDGTAPVAISEGALIDIAPGNRFMLTHEKWDAVWYWPDIAGEHYQQVVDRFVGQHDDGDIVVAYPSGWVTVVEDPERAVSFRLDFGGYRHFGQIRATPVAAIADDGASLVLAYDPAIPAERWLPTGPPLPLELKMTSYRWSLAYGKHVLNWADFD